MNDMEKTLGTDREAALADMRYQYIDNIVSKAVVKPKQSREQLRSLRIDSVLTHRIFAIPIFLAIMLDIFFLTFGSLGALLSKIFESGIETATDIIDKALKGLNVSGWMNFPGRKDTGHTIVKVQL